MEIILENFRSFVKKQSIPITPLTFLVGENSSGKSTFLAALSAIEGGVIHQYKPQFNDEPYDLGSFDTIATYKGGRYGRAEYFGVGLEHENKVIFSKFIEHKGQPILSMFEGFSKDSEERVNLEIKDDLVTGKIINSQFAGEKGHFTGPFKENVKVLSEVWLLHLVISSMKADFLPDFKNKQSIEIVYFFSKFLSSTGNVPTIDIAPIRTRPKRTYDEVNDEFKPEGDHIPVLLSRILEENSSQKQKLLNTLKSYGTTSGLFKDVKVKRLGRRPSDPFQLFVTVTGGRDANIVDVGYGVNQALPILIESILAPEDRRITMQQPEVHLHPRAQAALGSFMVDLVQKHKKQFVVETHSDYIVDRVRREVAEGRIDKDKVSILFFEKPGFETTVHVLKLDKQGNVLNAPTSYREFFLEEQMNLLMA